MNKMQIRGTVREVTGTLQEKIGKLIGNRQMQLRGIEKTFSAKAERIIGDATETIQSALKRHALLRNGCKIADISHR